jgi:predicted GIY-YIG superfamily endonuclease
MKRLKEQAEIKNLTLLQDSVKNAKSPLLCKCNICDKEWNSSYNSLVLKDAGCPSCNNSEKLSFEKALSRLKNRLNPNIQILEFSYKEEGFTADSKLKMSCTTCENCWETSYASLHKGSSCPACAKFGFQKDKPAILYILRVISEDDILLGYKFGITCDLERRITQHIKLCKSVGIKFESSLTWEYKTGCTAIKHEKILKKYFGKHFTKDQLPSGFSESISIPNFSEFLDIQNKLYSEYSEWPHME